MNRVAEKTDHALDSEKQAIYSRLMAVSTGMNNDDVLACMLTSVCVGEGAMPFHLGLTQLEYEALMQSHFPGVSLPASYMQAVQDDAQRFEEQTELLDLLMSHRRYASDETAWMAKIVVTGCMGGNHLWQDMGLWSRLDLTTLLNTNFPVLAQKNDKDMKWKKFFYKQLCQQEGIYVCRSPSCEVCPDYADCFGPED